MIFLYFYILELYYVTSPGSKIYKIKIKSLLKCPNIEETNKKTKVAINIPSNSGQIASAGHSIFYSDSDGNAILGTNVFQKSGKNTVGHPNAIILYIWSDNRLFLILLTIV